MQPNPSALALAPMSVSLLNPNGFGAQELEIPQNPPISMAGSRAEVFENARTRPAMISFLLSKIHYRLALSYIDQGTGVR
jgi:hypothetical protein